MSLKFCNFVDHIYPTDHEIKDTTDTGRSASYLDLYFEIDSEDWLKNFTTMEIITIFQLGTFHLYVVNVITPDCLELLLH